MTETFMAAEIAETGPALRRQLDANRNGDAKARGRARGRQAGVRRDHRARQLGPCGPVLQARHRAEARPRLRFARALDRLALPGAAAALGRGRDHHLAVGPEPRHRRDAAGGQGGGRDDDRARQRRRLARRDRRRRAFAAARRRGALGRRDQIDDRRACRRQRRWSRTGAATPVSRPRSSACRPCLARRMARPRKIWSKRSPRPSRSTSSAAVRPSPSPPRRR